MIFLVIALVAVAAVAVVSYLNTTNPPVSPNSPTTPANAPEIPQTAPASLPEQATPIPEEEVDAGSVEEESSTEPTGETISEEPDASATEANNAIEDGIHDAYFAKEVYEKTGNKQAKESPYSYTFNNNQDFSNKTKETVAGEILGLITEELNARNVFARADIILQALTAASYSGKNQNNGVGDTIQFHVFEMEPTLQKIESAPLGEEVFVVAKSFNLIDKEATITIHEKEELLVAKDAALNVIEAKENDEDAQELTELKATFDDDGIAKIKIKLRPKSDEDLKTWEDKLKGGVQDGVHNYTPNNPFTVETEAEKVTIAGTIETRSNQALHPDHVVKKEDIIALLTVGSNYTLVNDIPKYSKDKKTEYLWLKVSCDGEEECLEEEFLKEEGKYFLIGGCPRCGILTIEELDEVFPGGDETEKTEIMNAFNEANDKFGLNTCLQKAHFFAQVREEVGPGISISNGESLNYPVERLPTVPFIAFQVPGSPTVPNDYAFQYGRIDSRNINMLRSTYNRPNLVQQAANQEMIANVAYANRNGNGNISSGDGWRYRGKGIIQLTGRDKYDRVNSRIASDYPEFNIVIDADNVNNLREGTVASMAYWEDYGCKEKASEGKTQANVNEVINIINSGTGSRQARWEHFQRMLTIFKVNECNDGENSGWHHPLNRMELRVHYASTTTGAANSDHGPAPNRNTGSHDGLDLYAPIGTTVYACVDGEIYEDYVSGTYGNTLGIKGDYNGTTYYFFYAHLSSRSVVKGDTVKAGDTIGQTGTSGNAGTPHTNRHHLHFEVRTTDKRTGGRIDPLTTISELGTDVDTNADPNTQT